MLSLAILTPSRRMASETARLPDCSFPLPPRLAAILHSLMKSGKLSLTRIRGLPSLFSRLHHLTHMRRSSVTFLRMVHFWTLLRHFESTWIGTLPIKEDGQFLSFLRIVSACPKNNAAVSPQGGVKPAV